MESGANPERAGHCKGERTFKAEMPPTGQPGREKEAKNQSQETCSTGNLLE